MYYDARPATGWNGLFHPFTYELLKPYYAFWQFNKLYQLKNQVLAESNCKDIYVCAASNGERSAIQMAYYSETDLEDEEVEINVKGLPDAVKITTLLTDAEHDNQVLTENICFGPETTLHCHIKQHAYMLLCLDPPAKV